MHLFSRQSRRSGRGLLLSLILAGGIVLRLSLAGLTAQSDIHAFRSWMESAVKLGIAQSYVQQVSTPWTPVYPPVSVYMLQASGYLYKALISPEFEIKDPAYLIFTKLPSMAADMAAAVVLFLLFAAIKKPKHGLGAAAIYAFHPGVLYDSTLWGQMDAVYTLFLLGSIAALALGLPTWGVVAFLLACLSKQQTLAFLPLVLLLIPWKKKFLLRTAAICIGIIVILYLPFAIGGTLEQALKVFDVSGILGDSRLSWKAFNFWWVLYGYGAWDTPATDAVLGPLTYRHLGGIGFALAYALALFVGWKARHAANKTQALRAAFLAATLVLLGLFVLGPEMHDRYLFPVLALALPLALTRVSDAIAYVAVSAAFVFNIASVFPFGPFAQTPAPDMPVTRWIALIVTLSLGFYALRTLSVWPLTELKKLPKRLFSL